MRWGRTPGEGLRNYLEKNLMSPENELDGSLTPSTISVDLINFRNPTGALSDLWVYLGERDVEVTGVQDLGKYSYNLFVNAKRETALEAVKQFYEETQRSSYA